MLRLSDHGMIAAKSPRLLVVGFDLRSACPAQDLFCLGKPFSRSVYLIDELEEFPLRVSCQLASVGEHHADGSESQRVHGGYSDYPGVLVDELGYVVGMGDHDFLGLIRPKNRRFQLSEPV